MPRQARSMVVTQYSHIIVQVIEKKFIFKELYLCLLKNNLEDFEIEILGYCVIDDHIHIIIYTNNYKEFTKKLDLLTDRIIEDIREVQEYIDEKLVLNDFLIKYKKILMK